MPYQGWILKIDLRFMPSSYALSQALTSQKGCVKAFHRAQHEKHPTFNFYEINPMLLNIDENNCLMLASHQGCSFSLLSKITHTHGILLKDDFFAS